MGHDVVRKRFTFFGIMPVGTATPLPPLKLTGKPWHAGISRAANASQWRLSRVALGWR